MGGTIVRVCVCVWWGAGGWRVRRAEVPGDVGGRKREGNVWKASSLSSAYVGVRAHMCVLLLLWFLAC